jgi:EpsI family protein
MNKLKPSTLVAVFFLLSMVAGSLLAEQLKPSIRMVDSRGSLKLTALIPESFGDWIIDQSITPIEPSPDVQASLDELYNQLITRAYVNGAGERVMLSIAYGENQSSESTQVHRPEFCYVTQGFSVSDKGNYNLIIGGRPLFVKRLLAVHLNRIEPITYWVVLGDKVVQPGMQRKLAQLDYGAHGIIPDGLLFRVSSLSVDKSELDYKLQSRFIIDLYNAISANARSRLFGEAT